MRLDADIRRARRLSLTPLIDVIFLLLLFFMLSSTFTRFGEVEIAGSAAGVQTASTPDILVSLDGTSVRVNGISMDNEQAVAELSRLEDGDAETVLIVVGEQVASQALVQFVEAARRRTDLAVTVAR